MSARAGKIQELWNNRITGYADVPPKELLENPENFRRHPKEQKAALIGVLREVGFVDPVLVQAGTNLILDGHLRVEIALEQGQATIPVKYVNLTDAEAQIVLATFDPLSAMARHDASSLEALLAQVKVEDVALSQLLKNLSEEMPPVVEFNVAEHYRGMPAYDNENRPPFKQIIVSFENAEDMERFGRLLDIPLTMQTKGCWYPHQPRVSSMASVYRAENSDAT